MRDGSAEKLNDLVLELKGLVLVRDLLERRGTEVGELDAGIVRATKKLLGPAPAVC